VKFKLSNSEKIVIESDGRGSLISVFSLILGQKVARDLVEFRNKSDIQEGQSQSTLGEGIAGQSNDTLNSTEDSDDCSFSFSGLITKYS
jgi:hypothetical protein